MDETLKILKELTDAPGVSGFEEPARRVMRRHMEPLGEITTDNIGSIIGRARGGLAGGPRIVLAGHLDEIGFMVTRLTDDGYLKFQTLGGWWEQVMLAQRVEVHTRQGVIVGVIGSKPPHLLTPEERKKIYEKKDMFIDVGAGSRAEAESFGIRPGDPVVPICPFTVMKNEKLLMAKAWDNRFGCALDTGIAGDTPGISADEAQGKLGGGPVILLYDASMIPHVGLRDLVIDTAKTEGIPYQFDVIAAGGTDAGKIHLFGAGVPSLVLGVPVRYIHTHAAIMHRDDFDNAAKLLVAVIKRLDAETVQQLKS